ncbi:hypothetical protein DP067_00945 [Mycoplasmopsis anatis]|uniref:MGA_1079 family surface serine endopeptidase n=1 Tax=Mycoplasmopsis anatis TaxID=171279 RepID=UPI000DC6FDF3|nr:hypothetical protein [Mycoplasmopsis anatis]AWX69940.1 hypothetical protein DP067_00945 [Mycoplasmopsis anatis]VEU73633.1 Uncharacterised protein [Mycoplasmopsis anatis]
MNKKKKVIISSVVTATALTITASSTTALLLNKNKTNVENSNKTNLLNELRKSLNNINKNNLIEYKLIANNLPINLVYKNQIIEIDQEFISNEKITEKDIAELNNKLNILVKEVKEKLAKIRLFFTNLEKLKEDKEIFSKYNLELSLIINENNNTLSELTTIEEIDNFIKKLSNIYHQQEETKKVIFDNVLASNTSSKIQNILDNHTNNKLFNQVLNELNQLNENIKHKKLNNQTFINLFDELNNKLTTLKNKFNDYELKINNVKNRVLLLIETIGENEDILPAKTYINKIDLFNQDSFYDLESILNTLSEYEQKFHEILTNKNDNNSNNSSENELLLNKFNELKTEILEDLSENNFEIYREVNEQKSNLIVSLENLINSSNLSIDSYTQIQLDFNNLILKTNQISQQWTNEVNKFNDLIKRIDEIKKVLNNEEELAKLQQFNDIVWTKNNLISEIVLKNSQIKDILNQIDTNNNQNKELYLIKLKQHLSNLQSLLQDYQSNEDIKNKLLEIINEVSQKIENNDFTYPKISVLEEYINDNLSIINQTIHNNLEKLKNDLYAQINAKDFVSQNYKNNFKQKINTIDNFNELSSFFDKTIQLINNKIYPIIDILNNQLSDNKFKYINFADNAQEFNELVKIIETTNLIVNDQTRKYIFNYNSEDLEDNINKFLSLYDQLNGETNFNNKILIITNSLKESKISDRLINSTINELNNSLNLEVFNNKLFQINEQISVQKNLISLINEVQKFINSNEFSDYTNESKQNFSNSWNKLNPLKNNKLEKFFNNSEIDQLSDEIKRLKKQLVTNNESELLNEKNRIKDLINNLGYITDKISKNNHVDTLNSVSEINAYYQKLKQENDQLSNQKYVENLSKTVVLTINPKLEKANLVNHLSSLSINKNNIKLFLNFNLANENLEELIKQNKLTLKLDQENRNKLLISYKSINPETDLETTLTKELIFTNDINPVIDSTISEISSKKLEDYFEYDSSKLISLNRNNIDTNWFKAKNKIVNNYFTLDLKENSFSYVSQVGKKYLVAKAQLKWNDQVLSEIKLVSNQVAYEKSEDPVDLNLVANAYYNQTSYAKSEYKKVNFSVFKEIYDNNLDIFGVLDSNNHYYSFPSNLTDPSPKGFDRVKVIRNILSKLISYNEQKYNLNRLYNYSINNEKGFILAEYEFTNKQTNEIFYSNYYFNNLAIANSKKDLEDLNYIKNIFEDAKNSTNHSNHTTNSNIWKELVVLNKNITHSSFIASEYKRVFNEVYQLPKKGRYSIILVNDNSNTYSNVNGWAKFKIGIAKDNQLINDPNLQTSIYLRFFKPVTFNDYLPHNNNLTVADFSNLNRDKENDKNSYLREVNKINSRNFSLKKMDSYSVIDLDLLDYEKSYSQLNYLLQIGPNSPTQNDSSFVGEFDSNDKNSPTVQATFKNKDYNIFNPMDSNSEITNEKLNEIKNKFFIYYVDVRTSSTTRYTEKDKITFKLGFINKEDPTFRFVSENSITLQNLKNELKEEFYPKAAINNIPSDFISLQNSFGSTIKASWFKEQFDSGNEILQKIVVNDNLVYSPLTGVVRFKANSHTGSWKLFRKENFSVAKIVQVDDYNGTALVKLKYIDPEYNYEVISDVLYLVEGFEHVQSATQIDKTNKVTYIDSLITKNNLKQIIAPNNLVSRKREVEMNLNDALWEINQSSASWILKEKYFSDIMNNANNSEKKIILTLFAGNASWDPNRFARLTGADARKITIDFEELKSKRKLTYQIDDTVVYKNSNVNIDLNSTVSYTLNVTLIDSGIQFYLELNDKNQKIITHDIVKNLNAHAFDRVEPTQSNIFDNSRAFYVDNYASKISIYYENHQVFERFDDISTNLFSYKNMTYNQENTPIIWYDPKDSDDLFKYNPNQNVIFNLNNGYKFNTEIINFSNKNNKAIQNLMARSVAFNRGGASMLAKVNDDHNDGKFYLMTNNHVIGISSTTNDSPSNKPINLLITRSGFNYANNVDAGFGYWDGLYADSVSATVVWTGKGVSDQKNNDGTSRASDADITIFTIDINQLIDKFYKNGRIESALWYENWKNLENVKLTKRKYQLYTANAERRFSLINNHVDQVLWNGFPYGKQSGYIINRHDPLIDSGSNFSKQGNFMPTYYNAGNSGTGVFDQNNTYVTTINSGAPLKFLHAPNYYTNSTNYLGISSSFDELLNLANTGSFAHNVVKMMMVKPHEFELPWFAKK